MSVVLSLARARSCNLILLGQRRCHAYNLPCWINPAVRWMPSDLHAARRCARLDTIAEAGGYFFCNCRLGPCFLVEPPKRRLPSLGFLLLVTRQTVRRAKRGLESTSLENREDGEKPASERKVRTTFSSNPLESDAGRSVVPYPLGK